MKRKSKQAVSGIDPAVKETVDVLLCEALATVRNRQDRLAVAEAAMAFGEGVFRGCHDALGNPLSEDDCARIEDYLADPSPAGWADIQSIVISGEETLMSAWRKFDPRARASGGAGFPAPLVAFHFVRASVEENLAAARAMVDEILP